MESPYTPGFGARPTVLVGRDQVLSRAAATLTRVANSGRPATQVTVLTGTRGMGKTVTLGEIGTTARDRGFVTCSLSLDSVSDNIQLLAGRLAEAIAPLEGRAAPLWDRFVRRLGSLSVELNAGVVKVTSEPHARATETSARQALGELLTKAAEIVADHDQPGLVVLLDELQEAPRAQLVVLFNAVQDALTATGKIPMVIFAAGLPTTPEKVMDAASFTERFDFRTLDRLDQTAAERALLEPSLHLHVTWDADAVTAALTAAAGSPYLIQKYGDEAWLAADPQPGSAIELPDVAAAITQVRDGLDAGMFRGRWAKATPAEQALLTAIAQVADTYGIARTRDITALLDRTTPQLSSTRKALIDKGIIESVGTGLIRYAMPGFADFVLGVTQSPRMDRGGPTNELPTPSGPAAVRRKGRPRELPPAQS
jgi:hypothetical protein